MKAFRKVGMEEAGALACTLLISGRRFRPLHGIGPQLKLWSVATSAITAIAASGTVLNPDIYIGEVQSGLKHGCPTPFS